MALRLLLAVGIVFAGFVAIIIAVAVAGVVTLIAVLGTILLLIGGTFPIEPDDEVSE